MQKDRPRWERPLSLVNLRFRLSHRAVVRKHESHMHALFTGLDPKVIGTHSFTFRAALRCREAGLTEDQAIELIDARENECPRNFKPDEAEEAVASAYNSISKSGGVRQSFSAPDHALRAEIIAQYSGVTVESLRAASAEPLDLPSIEVLRLLFPNDPLLCIGDSKEKFRTGHLSSYRMAPQLLSGAQFLTPSPMKSKWGETKQGNPSQHCESNTGPRRFLIVEIDDESLGKYEQAGIICHLAEIAGLAAVVDSGNRSLHAWFFVSGQSEARGGKLWQFFDYACRLGADPALWRAYQFVRMPNGTRRDSAGNRVTKQQLLYLNPSARQGCRIAGLQMEGSTNV
jgi:hypothetical protein